MKKYVFVTLVAVSSLGLGSCCRFLDCCFDDPCNPCEMFQGCTENAGSCPLFPKKDCQKTESKCESEATSPAQTSCDSGCSYTPSCNPCNKSCNPCNKSCDPCNKEGKKGFSFFKRSKKTTETTSPAEQTTPAPQSSSGKCSSGSCGSN